MHDLDKIMRESGLDFARERDYNSEMGNDGEYDYEYDYELDDESYDTEMDYESDDEYDQEIASPFSEEMTSELAFELLSVNNEEELNEFLGKWIRRAGRFLKRKLPAVGRFLKKGLRGIAKIALPAVGAMVGGPIGSKAGQVASNLFEIELEGLSPEDQEFEIAKRVIGYGNETMRNVARIPGSIPPEQTVKLAFKKAAATHAPGMVKPRSKWPMQGSWRRDGSNIILHGVYRKRPRPY